MSVNEQLEQLVAWLSAHGSPIRERLAPGLPADAVATSLAGAGVPAVHRDVLDWFGFFNGYRASDVVDSDATLFAAWVPLSLDQALGNRALDLRLAEEWEALDINVYRPSYLPLLAGPAPCEYLIDGESGALLKLCWDSPPPEQRFESVTDFVADAVDGLEAGRIALDPWFHVRETPISHDIAYVDRWVQFDLGETTIPDVSILTRNISHIVQFARKHGNVAVLGLQPGTVPGNGERESEQLEAVLQALTGAGVPPDYIRIEAQPNVTGHQRHFVTLRVKRQLPA